MIRWLLLGLLPALFIGCSVAASPKSEPEAAGTDAISENQRRIDAMLKEQDRLLAQVREQLAALPPFTAAELASNPEARARQKRRQQLSKLLADIEQRMKEQNARPRKRYLSPATLGTIYTPYYNAICRKIEARGTENFPQADGHKLYGKLLMALLIHHDGRLIEASVVESSGNPVLDRLAQEIARSSAPFGQFTAEMRKDADQIDIAMQFNFTHDTAPKIGSSCDRRT